LIYFNFDDFEESMLTIQPDHSLLLALFMSPHEADKEEHYESKEESCLRPIFQGAVHYEAIQRVYDAKKRAKQQSNQERHRPTTELIMMLYAKPS
jgi:Uncharacterized conserved protein (DUF2045)